MKVETLIKKHNDQLDWNNASIKIDVIQLDNQLLNHLSYFWNWHFISSFHILSQSFMREFQGYIVWFFISQYQTLSESFIKKWENYVDWNQIKFNPNISNQVKERFNLI